MNVLIACQKSADDPSARGLEKARELAACLREAGIRVFVDWYSPRKFRADRQLHERCNNALENADALILLVEDAAHLKRTRAYRIWDQFSSKKHVLMAVYILRDVQESKLPRQLRDRYIVRDGNNSVQRLAFSIARESGGFREKEVPGTKNRTGGRIAAVIVPLLLIPLFIFLFSNPFHRNRTVPEPDPTPEAAAAEVTPVPVVDIMLPEGYTAERMAEKLESELDGTFSSERFLELCGQPDAFAEYPFVSDLMDNEKTQSRYYALEGYLFPDTYTFYADTDEETVIRKMLDRFQEITSDDEFQAALGKSGMTLDEAVTLASVIEREGTNESFGGISAVLTNRLAAGMMLQCDSTAQYAGATKRLATTIDDVSVDSPYNTYQYTGLPVGPISNPGRASLMAAVAPDAEYVSEGYLYFALTDPATGVIAFSKTYEDHLAVVEQYGDLWESWDAEHGQ